MSRGSRDMWCCIGCGSLVRDDGSRPCKCPSGLIFKPSHPNSARRGREVIVDDLAAHRGIVAKLEAELMDLQVDVRAARLAAAS